MLTEIQGDLFSVKDWDILVHGCNCQGKMGSGVAKLIREKYPQAYLAYTEAYVNNQLVLGSVIPCYLDNGKVILNALTQEYYGYQGEVYTDYEAVKCCMTYVSMLAEYMEEDKATKIIMPKIGCGLGGGDWSIVRDIINNFLYDYDVEVYYL